jgi:hypothetical protein
MMKQVEVNKEAKLSEHFKLGELTRSKSHPEVYNIPSRQVIENLKRVCEWLEALRERYNRRYVIEPRGAGGLLTCAGGQVPKSRLAKAGGQVPKVEVFGENFISRPDPEEPIIITSGYRSAELNRKVGGVATSNHLTGCAVDIRVAGKEQLIRYACILLDYADETKQDFDEILLEHGANGVIWLHFAVRPQGNRRKINIL